MQKHEFKTSINAAPEKVWDVLWDDASYRQWTSVFAEGSMVETDWKEGSKVFFLDGKGQGMVAQIAAKRPNEYMSFRHLGMVENGVEDVSSEKVKPWAGAMENYTLRKVDGKTELVVDIDITEDHKDYFLKTWPQALERVKELSEKN